LTLEDRLAPATVTSLADSGAGSLRDAVQAGGTIDFDPSLDGRTIRLNSQITVNSGNATTITNINQTSGNPVNITISGSNRTRIFEVAPSNDLTLTGLNLIDAYAAAGAATNAGNGGAILDNAVLTLNGDTFINNRADNSGGAIDISRTNNPVLTINNSTFTGNRARNGFGGAISSNDQGTTGNQTLTVVDSTFTDNVASGSGGAIDFFAPVGSTGISTLNVMGATTFAGNQGSNGGGIDLNVSATGSGAINIMIDLRNTGTGTGSFVDNVASGAITTNATTGQPNLSGYGGSIDGFFRLSGTATATVQIVGGLYSGNVANLGAGLTTTLRTMSDTSSGSVLIDQVNVQNNEAVWGGGIYTELQSGNASNASITVSNSTVANNLAQSLQTRETVPLVLNAQGGGIFGTISTTGNGSTGSLRFINDTVAYNSAIASTAMSSQGNGGGLYVEANPFSGGTGAGSTVTINSLTVAYNEADSSGGGLFIDNARSFAGPSVRNSVFDANVSPTPTTSDISGTGTSGDFNTTTSSVSWLTSSHDLVDTVANINLATTFDTSGSTPVLRPLTGSSLIGTGDDNSGPDDPSTDQLGVTRSTPTTRGAVQG
jgi:hypothetical protein